MMISDPWGLLLNQRGGGSIDMSRGFSGFGNLPPLDWMPNPGAEHGVDVRGQFPWNVADSYTYFRWYESVLFARAREEDRRLILGDSWKATRILLAGKFSEIQLDTSVAPRKVVNGVEYEFSDIGGYKGWHEVNPLAPRSQVGQPTAPPRSMPDWLEQFAPPSPLDPTASPPPAPAATSPTSSPFETAPARDPRGQDLQGLLSWVPLSAPSASPISPTWMPSANGLGAATIPSARGAQPSSASRGGESLRTAGQPSFAGRVLNDFGERLLDNLSALPASPLSIYHYYKTGKAMYEAYVKEKSFGAGFLMAGNVLNPLYHAEVARFQASEAADRGDYGEATGYGIQAALGYIQTLFLAVGIKNGLTSPVASRFFRTGGGVGGGTLKPQLKSALPLETTESAFANLIDNSEFSRHPGIIDRLSRARQFDVGGYKSLTAKGEYGRVGDMLDSDEALQNAFVRHLKGISRRDPLLADNPATALSPELHRQIGNLTSFEGRSAVDVLRLHIDQMRGFTPDYVLVVLERESLQFIKLLGL